MFRALLLIILQGCNLSLAFTSNHNNGLLTIPSRQYSIGRTGGPSTTSTTLCLSPDARVLTIGDALFDCIANDDARGCTVEELEANQKWTPFPGGAPANVATACCKLGTQSAFMGCLGQDTDGDGLVELLKDIGVDTSLVQRHESKPTRRVMVTRSKEGDREFGGFYEGRNASDFADCYLESIQQDDVGDDDDWDDYEKKNPYLFKDVDWVVTSTLSLAFPQSGQAVLETVLKAVKEGAKLYVDVNWRPVFWQDTPEGVAQSSIWEFCQQANVVKMTDEEAEWLFPGMTPEAALEDPKAIHELFFPKAFAVLITAGGKGAAYSVSMEDGMCSGKIEPFKVSVAETTGAGDAFTAGFIHALSQAIDEDPGFLLSCTDEKKEAIHEMVKFAAAVGAYTCTSEGAIAAQPTFEQIQSFLAETSKYDAKIRKKRLKYDGL